MFIAVMMGAGLIAGYLVTIGLSMLLTFAVTTALPRFVEANHLIRNPYKIVHELLWLLAVVTGSCIAAMIVKDAHPQLMELVLLASLIYVLWQNSWEARQRGTAHQVLITTLTVIGVAGGYLLAKQLV